MITLIRWIPALFIITLVLVTSTVSAEDDARSYFEKGKAALQESKQDHTKLIDATIWFEKAARLADALHDAGLAKEANAALSYCRKQFNDREIASYREHRDSEMADLNRRIAQIALQPAKNNTDPAGGASNSVPPAGHENTGQEKSGGAKTAVAEATDPNTPIKPNSDPQVSRETGGPSPKGLLNEAQTALGSTTSNAQEIRALSLTVRRAAVMFLEEGDITGVWNSLECESRCRQRLTTNPDGGGISQSTMLSDAILVKELIKSLIKNGDSEAAVSSLALYLNLRSHLTPSQLSVLDIKSGLSEPLSPASAKTEAAIQGKPAEVMKPARNHAADMLDSARSDFEQSERDRNKLLHCACKAIDIIRICENLKSSRELIEAKKLLRVCSVLADKEELLQFKTYGSGITVIRSPEERINAIVEQFKEQLASLEEAEQKLSKYWEFWLSHDLCGPHETIKDGSEMRSRIELGIGEFDARRDAQKLNTARLKAQETFLKSLAHSISRLNVLDEREKALVLASQLESLETAMNSTLERLAPAQKLGISNTLTFQELDLKKHIDSTAEKSLKQLKADYDQSWALAKKELMDRGTGLYETCKGVRFDEFGKPHVSDRVEQFKPLFWDLIAAKLVEVDKAYETLMEGRETFLSPFETELKVKPSESAQTAYFLAKVAMENWCRKEHR